MKGSDIIVKCLLEQNVKHVFGYSGSSILSLLQSLSETKRIKFITGTHEQFCGFSASGYARVSGKVGVVTATSGPGATNLVTAIADAYMDSVPLVAITGNVSLDLLGRDAFQETDIAGVTMPITKHNFIVKSASDLADTVRFAFKIASTGRKGPVLVDIPRNIFDDDAPYRKTVVKPYPLPEVDESSLDAAAELIQSAKSPIACAGGGVISSGASQSLKRFADLLKCPVALTYMGKGAFPEDDALFAGFLGMNSTPETENALRKADLFISVGMRFSERAVGSIRRINPSCRLLHIDIDEAEIGKNVEAFEAVVGDADDILTRLCDRLSLRERACENAFKRVLTPEFEIINRIFANAVFTTEVGLHQTSACANVITRFPRSFITSGGLGAMGFGLPAAIGAAIAKPGTKIVNIAGDGSFNMNLPALATAAMYRLPIVQLVFDNRSLGMISRWQDSNGYNRFGTDLPKIDYVRYAESVGARGIRANGVKELENALAAAKKARTPVLVDYMTEVE